MNPGDKTKLSCYTPYRHNTTVSLETYPLYKLLAVVPAIYLHFDSVFNLLDPLFIQTIILQKFTFKWYFYM